MQARRAAEAEARAAALEAAVAAAEAAAQEARVVHDGLRAQIAAGSTEADSMRQQMARQAREVRHARQLARDVTDERSEAQAFLVSSIRMVRRQLASQRDENAGKQQHTRAGRAGRRTVAASPACAALPTAAAPLTPASQTSTGSSSAQSSTSSTLAAAASVASVLGSSGGRPVDSSEMSWEEREAVLRLLLAQVNNVAAAAAAQETFAAVELDAASLAPPADSPPEQGSPVCFSELS